jgi:hypothetical protein
MFSICLLKSRNQSFNDNIVNVKLESQSKARVGEHHKLTWHHNWLVALLSKALPNTWWFLEWSFTSFAKKLNGKKLPKTSVTTIKQIYLYFYNCKNKLSLHHLTLKVTSLSFLDNYYGSFCLFVAMWV